MVALPVLASLQAFLAGLGNLLRSLGGSRRARRCCGGKSTCADRQGEAAGDGSDRSEHVILPILRDKSVISRLTGM
ncbi:MAG: hypothetical protein ACJAU5_001343 [Maricaulis maris]|jgi:hypothetical protein